jgi:hypothetical protein
MRSRVVTIRFRTPQVVFTHFDDFRRIQEWKYLAGYNRILV